MSLITRLLALLLLTVAAPVAAQPAAPGLKVPPGFTVTEFADQALANDIYCLTTDPKGHIVVSGRGFIRTLVDDDGDGRADRAVEFAGTPKDGAMGMLWEGDTLYVTGDGGLRRFRDRDGDGKADGPSELIRRMKTGGEHAAHAIRRGPDGLLYVLCGNNTGIDASYAELPTSPVKDPIAGCVLRFSPELKQCEVVAHGFRNAYGMDFNLDGELFAYDSDNERCVSLPWYEPTRLYHVVPGRFYGWLSPQRASFWRLPSYLPDVMAPAATLGRGSPTSVVCYAHTQFPKAYQGSLFLCDWTFGKVYHVPLRREGMTYHGGPEVFLSAAGENGFAPTGIAVQPKTGDLFISIGGRGTRGGVYRVRYTARARDEPPPTPLTVTQRAPGMPATDLRPPGEAKELVAEVRRRLQSGDVRERLVGARLVQLALGDAGAKSAQGTVWEGYTPARNVALPGEIPVLLAEQFPSGDVPLDRELSRTLAMLGRADPAFLGKLEQRFGENSDPVEDIHYLAVAARIPGPRTEGLTRTIAAALIALDEKITRRKLNRDSHWPLRVREICTGLAEKDIRLHAALLRHPAFGRPDHALYAQAFGFPRGAAAAVFFKRWRDEPDYRLSPAVVGLLAELPTAAVLPEVRRRWGDTGQETALLPLLARAPWPEDRGKFIDGLTSSNSAAIRASLEALEQLKATDDGSEALALLLCLRRLPDAEKVLRSRVRQRLGNVSGLGTAADEEAFLTWFQKAYTERAARLTNPDGVDVAAWEKRLARVDWPAGDARRGELVYRKSNCANCHTGGSAVGPDLTGVAGRFSRDDLFTAILRPSRDVPARYQTTVVETHDGKVHQGVVIYDAVDSLILQTATATVRLDGRDVATRRTAPTSLMPPGLLDPLNDGELADLYAYLRTLGGRPN